MYYEFYIDIFFLENMVMDYALLLVVGQILGCKILWRRLLLGSFAGALGACVLMLIPVRNVMITFVFGYGLLSVLMIKIGFIITQKRTLRKGVLLLYGTSFLAGGIFQTLFSQITLPVILLGMFSVLLLTILLKGYESIKYRTQNLYDVTISVHEKEKHICGLKDTGNQLKEPVTGKPVSIVDYSILQDLIDKDAKMLLIPYHSIGKPNGLLPGMTVDYISIQRESQSQRIDRPMIALSREPVSSRGDYQIILNPVMMDE